MSRTRNYIILFFLLLVCLSGCRNIPEIPSDLPILQPFVINNPDSSAGAVDISFLLDKPAGKKGFIKVKDGKLVNPDGERFRLWGVNITDWTRGSLQIPDKDEADFYARTLARYGINCVRLTFLDFTAPRGIIDPSGNDTRRLDTVNLDKLDYWISQLKNNGIYTDLNLLVGRTFKPGDSIPEYDKIGWGKYASYFDPQLVKLQKEFARQLLTHYNPYTRSEYWNEPAIAIVELVNENTLFDAWHRNALHATENVSRDPNFRPLTLFHEKMLTKLYNEYLVKNFTKNEIDLIRTQAGTDEQGMIVRPEKKHYGNAGEEWLYSVLDFYVSVESDFFKDMRGFLKDSLKVNSLLIGSNDFLHNQSEYPMVISNRELDILDGHVYWQHPSWPGKINTPMVNEPDSSTIAKLSRTAVDGIPYSVTEYNNAFPSDYECEGIPIISAYGSFQDWDALMLYTYEPKHKDNYKGYVGDAFDISHHPVKMPQMIAGALMYLRGDISAATETVLRGYSEDEVFETMRMAQSEAPYYTPVYSVSNVFRHRVRIGSLDETDNSRFRKENPNRLISDTRELSWTRRNNNNGLVIINSSNSQALIGFVKDSGESTENLSVEVDNDFCAITLSSLDGKSISESSRLLLVAGGKTENTGQQWDSLRIRVLRRGGPPSRTEIISGYVVLKGVKNAQKVDISPLDGSGIPMHDKVQATRKGKDWIFHIGDEITTWYIIDIHR